ncbi:MAG: CCA tRNA nucleotidyltransferase [Candidatus Poseidoniales archaeon]
MMEGPTLTKGLQADLDGQPCPPQLLRWLAALDDDLISLLETIAKEGEGAWLVGGCVRDAWLGAPSTDIDVCTTCPPDRLLTLFGDRAIPTGIEFGTVTVKGQGKHYEVTTLRTESLYRDGRRPEHVEWGVSLREDLSRRDFTFNSMAVDVARQEMYDPFDGVGDLAARRVRAVGDATLRCEEDALRILRAYRFMRRDEGALWKMEPSLHDAIAKHRNRLTMVAIERRWMELRKILNATRPGEVLHRMQEDGVLRFVFTHIPVFNPETFRLLDDPTLEHLTVDQRLAVLMSEHQTKDLLDELRALRTSKELQRATALFHEQLGHLPTGRTADMRVFQHVMGSAAEAHLAVHKALTSLNINLHTGSQPSVSDVERVVDLWSRIDRSGSTKECLVDGHWIMARTGDVEGIRLGRLKQWLHRIQIEENLTTQQEMATALSKLPYEHGSHEAWPTPTFP